MKTLYEKLIENVASYNMGAVAIVRKAYDFAYKFHAGQKRADGTEYINHPLMVACILSEMKADVATLCASLLHDTLEDTSCTKEDILTSFGEEIYTLVEGVSKFPRFDFQSIEDVDNANLRKLMKYINEDARVMVVKLADRLHNMRTLKFKNTDKQIAKAEETRNIFVPFAKYLGAYHLCDELSELSFEYLNPTTCLTIKDTLNNKKDEHLRILSEMIEQIKELLLVKGIDNNIIMRFKNASGVYEKLNQGYHLEEINDLIALKILVDKIDECFLALEAVHSLYKPVNSLIKDHINNPKTNMYQSLHTTVFGPKNRLVQARIKTNEMDENNIRGILRYYDGNKDRGAIQQSLQENYSFFKTLQDIDDYYEDDASYVEQLHKEIFASKIYVYNMNGDIIELPSGSTVIDFVASLGEEVFKHIMQTLINGKVSSFDVPLKNGDRIQIVLGEAINNLAPYQVRNSKTVRVRKYLKK